MQPFCRRITPTCFEPTSTNPQAPEELPQFAYIALLDRSSVSAACSWLQRAVAPPPHAHSANQSLREQSTTLMFLGPNSRAEFCAHHTLIVYHRPQQIAMNSARCTSKIHTNARVCTIEGHRPLFVVPAPIWLHFVSFRDVRPMAVVATKSHVLRRVYSALAGGELFTADPLFRSQLQLLACTASLLLTQRILNRTREV